MEQSHQIAGLLCFQKIGRTVPPLPACRRWRALRHTTNPPASRRMPTPATIRWVLGDGPTAGSTGCATFRLGTSFIYLPTLGGKIRPSRQYYRRTGA